MVGKWKWSAWWRPKTWDLCA